MKIIKLFFAIAIISLIAVSCKETKKEESSEDSIEVTDESGESTEVVAEEEVTEPINVEETEENVESTGVAVENTEVEKEVEAKAVEVTSKEVEKMVAEEGVIIEKLADTPVIYPGCEAGSADEIRACSIKKFKNFVGSNFDKDLSSGLDLDKGEHKIRALLKIDKSGKVTVRKIVASRVELENEIIRIIGKLPNMTPATKGGSPVDVSFVVPVDFKVEGY
jgi:hypothetical protein